MNTMFEQVLILLNSETGSLAYHLVLSFSIIGALVLTQGQWDNNRSPRARRILIGLSLLLGMQLLLFVVAGLAWQSLVPGDTLLPPLDRAVTLISLLLIVWLWAFPLPTPAADTASVLLGLLILTGAVLGFLYWSDQATGALYNGSLPDILAQIAAALVLLLGMISLLLRRPDGWTMGISMQLLLIAGPLLQIVFLPDGENYPSIIRLSQMAAFPFLLFLPRYLSLPSTPTDKTAPVHLASKTAAPVLLPYDDTQLWPSLLALSAERETESVQKMVAATLAKATQSDICLLLEPPDQEGLIKMLTGYNLHHNLYIEPLSLDSQSCPLFVSAFKMGRVRRISHHSDSPDIKEIVRAFDLEKSGNLLFIPVLASDGTPQVSVALLSPYTQRDWTAEEQSFLSILAKVLIQFLKRNQESAALSDQLQHSKVTLRHLNEQTQSAMEEAQKLRDKLVVLEERKQRDAAQIASMAALAGAQEAVQRSLDDLQKENESLKAYLNQEAGESTHPSTPLAGELRLALEEVAHLNAALQQAEKRLSELQHPSSQVLSTDIIPIEDILSIAQDLRQPLSSIVGYTDFLLAESIGILGAKQRKFLERIQKSTERMQKMVADLVQKVSPESNVSHLSVEEIDLNALIQSVLEEEDDITTEKQVAIVMELPDHELHIYSDQKSLEKIFKELIGNASAVTPSGGQVAVSARLEHSEMQDDYVLVQVMDSGHGIHPPDLARVFMPRAPGDRIDGISNDNGLDLAGVKALVEILGGRTWVDSEPGHGATFSVLLPVSSALDNPNGSGGAW